MHTVHTKKGTKKPLTCGNTVPEVGLEPGSSPCKHWTPAETYGIRPGPRPKVWTLSTPPFLPTRGLPQTAAPRSDRARRFFALKNLLLPEKFTRGCNRVLPALCAAARTRPHGAVSLQALHNDSTSPSFQPTPSWTVWGTA